jgi:hypothetical protein
LLDEKMRKNYGENARKVAMEKFHTKQMIDKLEEIYKCPLF